MKKKGIRTEAKYVVKKDWSDFTSEVVVGKKWDAYYSESCAAQAAQAFEEFYGPSGSLKPADYQRNTEAVRDLDRQLHKVAEQLPKMSEIFQNTKKFKGVQLEVAGFDPNKGTVTLVSDKSSRAYVTRILSVKDPKTGEIDFSKAICPAEKQLQERTSDSNVLNGLNKVLTNVKSYFNKDRENDKTR